MQRETRNYYKAKAIWDQLKEIELHDFIYYRHENVKTIKAFWGSQHLVAELLAGEVGQDKAGAVDILVVVAAAHLLLLLGGPSAEGLAHVAGAILAADHEADLTGWVGGDSGVGVFSDGENLFAGFLEASNHIKVKPLVLG